MEKVKARVGDPTTATCILAGGGYIYNCDETDLYINAMSNKSLDTAAFRGHKIVQTTRVSICFARMLRAQTSANPWY